MTEPIAVLYDAKDAELFLARNPRVRLVVTMTPDARAAMPNAEIGSVISSDERLGDSAERRILARVYGTERQLENLFRQCSELGPAARETLKHDLRWLGTLYSRLWAVLGKDGPWTLPTDDGLFTFNSRGAAHTALLQRLRRAHPNHIHSLGRARPAFAVRLLNRAIARMARAQNTVATPATGYGMSAFMKSASAAGNYRFVCITGCSGTQNDLFAPLASVFYALFQGQTLRLRASAAPSRANEQTLALLSLLTDSVYRRGNKVFGPLLADQVGLTDGLAGEMAVLMDRLNARAVFGYSLRWGSEAALGEAAKNSNRRSILVSHGSHTPQTGGVGAAVEKDLGTGILVSPLADVTLVQSPAAARTAKNLAPALPRLKTNPIMWGLRGATARTRRPVKRILHAGTFKPMRLPRPWAYETPDEYVKGLRALINAASHLKRTELVIRLRDLPECSLETLRTLLPSAPNCTFKSEGAFTDDLMSSDLLVSYASTTIEESLHAGRPVLLWGGTARYTHLQGRSTPPLSGDRAAVYHVRDEKLLAGMLEAILAAHDGTPLTDEEIAPFVWRGLKEKKDLLGFCLEAPIDTPVLQAGTAEQSGTSSLAHQSNQVT